MTKRLILPFFVNSFKISFPLTCFFSLKDLTFFSCLTKEFVFLKGFINHTTKNKVLEYKLFLLIRYYENLFSLITEAGWVNNDTEIEAMKNILIKDVQSYDLKLSLMDNLDKQYRIGNDRISESFLKLSEDKKMRIQYGVDNKDKYNKLIQTYAKNQ